MAENQGLSAEDITLFRKNLSLHDDVPTILDGARALKELGLPRQDVVMVGDDIETDIGGAQNAGIRGVLVKTGKYREDTLARSTVRPAVVVGSVADVQAWFRDKGQLS